MKLAKFIIVFLILNFTALYLGSWLMNNGPQTNWYIHLNKAPWTPPGWVFGVTWTVIMICFSIFMAFLYNLNANLKVLLLYMLQWLLNIVWNFIFFNQHNIGLGLTTITLLTVIIMIFFFAFRKEMKFKSLLILPYLIWLCLATSLNAYIFLNNQG
ncbi:TspO/MBR family protein [Snuella lapsa]|uniref:TspO/MBR family protein n=1 Tax=Snuella lapsa TaxID=870481 RepID=UPI0031EB2EB9